MDYKSIAERLHELEQKVLLALKKKDSQISDALVKTAGIDESSVNRALLWLESKGLVTVKKEVKELISLDINGEASLSKGLPEKRMVGLVLKGVKKISELQDRLSKDEFNVSLGLLKSQGYIGVSKGEVAVTKLGKTWFKKETAHEKLIKKLGKDSVDFNELSKDLQRSAKELLLRKNFLKKDLKTIRTASLGLDGKKVIKLIKKKSLLGQLTPEVLASGSWKRKSFRKYDLKTPSPRVFRGKKSLATYMKEKIRRIFLDMGFTEMKGDFLELSFWNFDALYQPQDHPARDMHDTFFIKDPAKGALPSKELVKRVARVHENGGDTGSTGWGYDWKEEVASRNVLRTHTTGLSARTLSTLSEKDLPAKFFSADTVFRNETLDYKHLFQFQQVEGIIVDPEANFRNLLGLLKSFFNKLGFEKARFRPGYYPYTEMSVEPEVFHPIKKDWMALGGAGMFRPEVVKPLMGVDVPVLAWGLSFERPIMDIFNIMHMRDIYSDDLNVLKERSSFTKRF